MKLWLLCRSTRCIQAGSRQSQHLHVLDTASEAHIMFLGEGVGSHKGRGRRGHRSECAATCDTLERQERTCYACSHDNDGERVRRVCGRLLQHCRCNPIVDESIDVQKAPRNLGIASLDAR
jgi:hypothetical protein